MTLDLAVETEVLGKDSLRPAPALVSPHRLPRWEMCMRADAEWEVRVGLSKAQKATKAGVGAAGDPALLPGSASLTRDLLSPLLPPTSPLDNAWWHKLPQSTSREPGPVLAGRSRCYWWCLLFIWELLGSGKAPDPNTAHIAHV